MEWSDVRIFLAIARAGTLGAAAKGLGLAQPTVGRRLRALEAAVGHTLFQRTSGGLVLTDEGGSMRVHAERMEQEALAIDRRIAGQQRQLEGALRLTATDWFAVHVLPPVLADYSRRHPLVLLDLNTEARFLDLSRREADLAFRIRPFEEPDVVSRKLLHMPYGVYQRRDLPMPAQGDGHQHRLIGLGPAFAGDPDDSWLQRHLPAARTVFRCSNRDVQARMCAQGLGIAVLPRPLGDALPELQRIDLGEQPPGRDTWIGYHRDLRRLARLRAFVDLVVAHLAGA